MKSTGHTYTPTTWMIPLKEKPLMSAQLMTVDFKGVVRSRVQTDPRRKDSNCLCPGKAHPTWRSNE
uniref:Uncharacterized protein n=1 Tax=Arundo donax TaxID=35708 RepID=A0A0A8Z1K1_ARUDO